MVQSSLNPIVNPVVDTEPGYGQVLTILKRRFPSFLLVLLASIGVAAIVTKKTPPTYKSSMQLLIEANYQGKSGASSGIGASGSQFTDSDIQIDTATQLNLMQSSGLIQKAVDLLKPDYPSITVADIKRSLAVTQIKVGEDNLPTKIFLVEFRDTDPIKTEKVLSAIQQIYLNYNKEQQKDRLTRGLIVISKQLEVAGNDASRAEANLEQFRKIQNITDPETKAKALQDTLVSIQQQRVTARSQYDQAIARYKSLQQQLQSTPQNALVEARLSQSARYQSLLNEIQKTELALAQQRLLFTDDNPKVKDLIEQLQSQKELLRQEQGRTLGGLTNQENTQPEKLLEEGQKSQIDLNLASQLVETQTNIVSLTALDQALAGEEQKLRTELKRFPMLLALYSKLQPQVQLSQQRYDELLRAEQQLQQELAKGGFNWQVVEPPQKGLFLGPDLRQNLLLGGVVGLMLGGIAAALREASDDSVHTTAELEKQVSLPLLGTTPKLPVAKNKESVIKLPFGKPEILAPWTVQVLQSSPRWESLDLIFKNIELMNSVSSLKSLMVTSALADQSKSALTLGLAMSAARLHKRVLLIDGNLREPSLHKQLNLPNEQGLSTLLASDATLPNHISIQSSGSSYIDILTAGPVPADPANLLSSPRMEQLIATFEQNYDLVLIDAPPVIGLVDAMIAGSYCRSVVLVASIGKVTRTQLTQATAMLSRLNLIGVVANGVSDNTTYVPYVKQQRFALEHAMEK